jgi:hypothetical protein
LGASQVFLMERGKRVCSKTPKEYLAIIVATLLIEPFVKIDLNKGISLLGIILYIVKLPALRTKNRRLPLILVAVGLLVLLITKQSFFRYF